MLVKVVFSGRVQGVGFRYTAQAFAQECAVFGTVKNQPDGSVELYAQGSKENIDMLLNKLKNYFGKYIEHVDIQELKSGENYTDFNVVR